MRLAIGVVALVAAVVALPGCSHPTTNLPVTTMILSGSIRVVGGPIPASEGTSAAALPGRPSPGQVQVHLGHRDGPVVATAAADADGRFSATVAPGGPYVVTATETSDVGATCLSAPITATNPSAFVIVTCDIR